MIKKINKDNWEGIKFRKFPEYNYSAVWNNLSTIRFDLGEVKELPPEYSEFYDVSLGNKCISSTIKRFVTTDKDKYDTFVSKIDSEKIIHCGVAENNNFFVEYLGNCGCPFCYVSANPNGKYYEDICETWKKWMNMYEDKYDKDGKCLTNKVLQIAIGSEGEPCEVPMFCDFLKTVYETNVVPNYTTNGVVLSYWNKPESKWYKKANDILASTQLYAGGVAVSYGNKALRKYADDAIKGLLEKGDCHVMIHHIISDMNSVDEFVEAWKRYGDKIRNHVLLPLMPSGRSKKGIDNGVFEYLEQVIEDNNIKNVAFGAHFIKYLEKSDKIKTWLYPAESYSKNVLLTKDKVQITPSSFNLTPIKIINL